MKVKVKGNNNQIIIAGRDVNYVIPSKAEIKRMAKDAVKKLLTEAVCLELKKISPKNRNAKISS